MNAEKLAYWFFRLNGCFTFENFIVHPDSRGPQRTDADVIAVRFQHRSELEMSDRPMRDHEFFGKQPRLISVFLAEAKQGQCALNGPWTEPERENLHRVLFAMGFLPHGRVSKVAEVLYRELGYEDDLVRIRFVAVGREHAIHGRAKDALQLSWEEVLSWIHDRFSEYADQKAHHPQWDGSGRRLFRSATRDYCGNTSGFVAHWLQEIGAA